VELLEKAAILINLLAPVSMMPVAGSTGRRQHRAAAACTGPGPFVCWHSTGCRSTGGCQAPSLTLQAGVGWPEFEFALIERLHELSSWWRADELHTGPIIVVNHITTDSQVGPPGATRQGHGAGVNTTAG